MATNGTKWRQNDDKIATKWVKMAIKCDKMGSKWR